MENGKKNIKKILAKIACVVAVIGFLALESWLIVANEISHQKNAAEQIYSDVILNLDMIKIAAQSGDVDMFNKNLDAAKVQIKKADNLFMLDITHKDYTQKISTYLDLLETKKDLIAEISSLKIEVANVKTTLMNNYGDKTNVTRDNIKTAAEQIMNLKINNEEYSLENIKEIANLTNSMLENFANKSSELAKCIDSCYKDSITGINNSLKEIFQTFLNNSEAFNLAIEKEFEFDIIDTIKAEKPEV